MRLINNRRELNQYYTMVDSKLKNYMMSYKVRPSELLVYVENNLVDLKEEFGLSDVVGIDKVFLDVANHYHNSQLDHILKFESFRKM